MTDLRLDVRTGVDEKGLVTAAALVDRLDDGVDDLGDTMRGTGRDAERLQKQIDQTSRKMRSLAREIARADDAAKRLDLEKSFGDESRSLGKLKRIAKALDGFTDSAAVAVKMANTAGSSVGTLGQLKTALGPVGDAGITGAIAGAAALSAPLLAGGLAAAVSTALSGGVIAGGIASAARDPQVGRAWDSLASQGMAAFEDFGDAFATPTAKAIDIFRTSLKKVDGDLDALSASASKLVVPFARGVGGFVEQALPGIRKIVDAAGPIFDVWERELPMIGAAFDSFGDSISDASGGGAEALQALLRVAEFTLVATGETIEFLSKNFENLAAVVKLAGDAAGPAALLFRDTAGAGKDVAIAFDGMTKPVGLTADEMDRVNDAFDKFVGRVLGPTEAAARAEEAFDKLAEAVKLHGAGMDIANEAGRENVRILGDWARGLADARQANLDAGMTVDESNAKYAQQLDQLGKNAIALGLNRDRVRELVDQMKLVPLRTIAEVGIKGLPEFLSAAQAMKLRLDQIPREIRVGVGIYDLGGQYTSPYSYTGKRHGGIVAAKMGMITDHPTVLFGERGTGKEAFVPQKGISDQRAGSLLSTAAGWFGMDVVPRAVPMPGRGYNSRPTMGGWRTAPTPTVFEIRSGGSRLDDLLVEVLAGAIRGRGGDVQVVLGG